MRGLRRRDRRAFVLATAAALAAWITPSAAQAQDGAAPPSPQFAPGVLTTIEPALDSVDALSLHDLVELRSNDQLQWQPSKWLQWQSATAAPTNRTLYDMAQAAAFTQNVWCLELAFKPLRMIDVDVPVGDGRVQRKRLMYLVYRVRNTGATLDGEVKDDGEFASVAAPPAAQRFVPQFVLTSQERPGAAASIRKAYLDRIVPVAMEAITRRELPGGQLLDSVAIAERELPVEAGRAARGTWGVAIWEDVDPEIDFFSVYVGGLTNAYKWADPPGAYQPGDPAAKGRKFTRKMLQLNFWRPGDAVDPNEREIRFGVAPGEGSLYGAGEGVAYQWVYR